VILRVAVAEPVWLGADLQPPASLYDPSAKRFHSVVMGVWIGRGAIVDADGPVAELWLQIGVAVPWEMPDVAPVLGIPRPHTTAIPAPVVREQPAPVKVAAPAPVEVVAPAPAKKRRTR